MIEFENAGFSYGDRTVLRDLNLALPPGAFQILLGPSGAGKTTFLRLCHMDLLPTTGRVRFFNRAMSPRNRGAVADLRRAVGLVSQACPFIDHLSLVENIALPLQVSGIDMQDRAGDLRALLEWVDLTGQAQAKPPELSEGERRRAALARAVILSPDVILADEPTGTVDADMGLRLLTLLIELNRMGKSVLIATHDPDAIQAVRARVEPGILQMRDSTIDGIEAGA